ncbi:hypothetical protein JMJ77_0014845, partial [Colletotrichum scovillei]
SYTKSIAVPGFPYGWNYATRDYLIYLSALTVLFDNVRPHRETYDSLSAHRLTILARSAEH